VGYCRLNEQLSIYNTIKHDDEDCTHRSNRLTFEVSIENDRSELRRLSLEGQFEPLHFVKTVVHLVHIVSHHWISSPRRSSRHHRRIRSRESRG